MQNSSNIGVVDNGGFLVETPTTILKWSNETFGPRTALEIATRTSCEVNEVFCAIVNQSNVRVIHEELADCAIMLWQIAELLGLEARPKFRTPPHKNQNISLIAAQFNRRFATVLEELILNSIRPVDSNLQDHSLQIAREVLSDVLRLLELLASKFNIELAEHVDVKMVINRARIWGRSSNGNFQHEVQPA